MVGDMSSQDPLPVKLDVVLHRTETFLCEPTFFALCLSLDLHISIVPFQWLMDIKIANNWTKTWDIEVQFTVNPPIDVSIDFNDVTTIKQE